MNGRAERNPARAAGLESDNVNVVHRETPRFERSSDGRGVRKGSARRSSSGRSVRSARAATITPASAVRALGERAAQRGDRFATIELVRARPFDERVARRRRCLSSVSADDARLVLIESSPAPLFRRSHARNAPTHLHTGERKQRDPRRPRVAEAVKIWRRAGTERLVAIERSHLGDDGTALNRSRSPTTRSRICAR